MEIWIRVMAVLAVWTIIEGADYALEAVNLPWWLSLLMAAFCSIADIIFIFALDVIFDE